MLACHGGFHLQTLVYISSPSSDWWAGKQVVHLIVSRSATGSSVRFVAAFVCAILALLPPPVMPLTPSGSTDRLAHLIGTAAVRRRRKTSDAQALAAAALPGEPARPVTARRVLGSACAVLMLACLLCMQPL